MTAVAHQHHPAPPSLRLVTAGAGDEPALPTRCALCRVDYPAGVRASVGGALVRVQVANVWLADNSSVEAAVCDLCRNVLAAPPTGEVFLELNGQTVTGVVALPILEQLRRFDAELDAELDALTAEQTAMSARPGIVVGDRARSIAVADRLLFRQAADVAMQREILAAAELQATMIRQRAATAAARIEGQMWWRRQALEELAAELFPDASAKKKSFALTYGTIGRKDFKATPELADDEAALAACRAGGLLQHITVVIKQPMSVVRQWLVNYLVAWESRDVQADGDDPRGAAALRFLDELVAEDDASLALFWSGLKRAITADGLEPPAGVTIAPARTEYLATVTEG